MILEFVTSKICLPRRLKYEINENKTCKVSNHRFLMFQFHSESPFWPYPEHIWPSNINDLQRSKYEINEYKSWCEVSNHILYPDQSLAWIKQLATIIKLTWFQYFPLFPDQVGSINSKILIFSCQGKIYPI